MSETPILDLEAEPPPLPRPWIAWIVGGILGILLTRFPVAVDFYWWLPLLYFSIAVHEIGHLLAARLVGMETGGIVIGGLMIFKSGARWLVRFEFRRILSGGLAKPLPKKTDLDSGLYAWMIAGGPIATIVLAAVAGIVGWRTLWWLNIILAVSTVLPSRGLNKSDGARLWLLLRNPAESRSWIAVLQVQAQETEGVLPRDWDADLVDEMLRGGPGNSDNSYRQLLAFYRRIDQGDEAAALLHLEGALAASGRCGRIVRQWCFLEAACSSALLRANPANGRTWLGRAVKLGKPQSKASTEAAIAMAEYRYDDAIRLWDDSLAFIAKRKVDSGLVRLTKTKIAEYRAACVGHSSRPVQAATVTALPSQP